MRKLSVPYTIRRRGIYYLNLRWNNQFIRQTLATKDPIEAFQKVNALAPILSNSQVSKQTLKHQLSDILGTSKQSNGRKLAKSSESTLLLSEAFHLYKTEQSIENWGVRTASQNEATFRQLTEVVGDISVSSMSKAIVRDYKQALLSYPANRYKGWRKDKTLEELQADGCRSISLETVRNIMGRVSSFFNWLVAQGYREDNPFTGTAPRRAHSARSERSPFSDDDLRLIFSTPIFLDKAFKHDWQYWLPLLGFFTGARLEELCQLKREDIQVSEGVYFLNINPDGHPENRLKSPSSIRLIPLHKELIKLGFLSVVESCSRGAFLFGLTRINTNLGHVPSKWFGSYKASLGLPKRTKVFHSFRHTLRDKLTISGVANEHIREILGHEQIGETFGRYGSSIPVDVLAASINRVSLPLSLE